MNVSLALISIHISLYPKSHGPANMASEPTLTPKQLPSNQHEVIAVLESIHVPWEDFDSSPRTNEVLLYKNTIAGQDDIAARIRDASIVICTICRLTAETLRQAPYL